MPVCPGPHLSDRNRGGARRATVLTLGVLLLLTALSRGHAQEPPDPEESRRRIEAIRAERQRLEQEQARLQGQLTDVGVDLRNLERQRDATNRLINEIDRQISTLGSQLDQTSAQLVLAQDNLAERRAVLERRLVDIYKRGPLHTVQVLLAAESFADLLTRYKYLDLTSRQDRTLFDDIQRLNQRMIADRQTLLAVRDQLDRRKDERGSELERYRQLATARARRLNTLRSTARQTQQRITALERDEARLNEVLASLERTRRASPGSRPVAGAGITTDDIGRLDWPVEGRIVFQFGRETLPGGGIIRWNGIGIGAPIGTPVQAVADGRIAVVQNLNTYGLTAVLEHGNGYYSLYMQLAEARVRPGDQVTKGQVLGTVGGANTDKGPHLHFEIRGENQIALDPLDWLRRRR